MKKLSLFSAFGFALILFLQAMPKTDTSIQPELSDDAPEIPENVMAVVQQKCYGCHNAESKNEKGKEKLDWDELESAKKGKALATMKKITEVLEEGEMPPAKFLERKPEGQLTPEEKATLLEWSTGKKK
ncbi:MAG: heme-binding domain-containing protein [Algoriphagus sp.]|uniref:heme-binding domain-containing protein n=1 Tax=Algoriphagus sp. TaxID=1872435 RepID=UPI00180A5679|nr:heme-binding domain-containing protein [Algoriphagus sp.]NVJ87711.1 heme-binding domain-containing protein [Algoriphagus sp.]